MIPLTDMKIEFRDIESQVVGAGILPISIDGENRVRVLLGKERYVNHWRGSLRWSGFEGGRKCGESVEETAAREFVEESMGVVSLDGRPATIENVSDAMRKKQYFARIVLCMTTDSVEKRYHVTYLVQIEYLKDVSSLFLKRRAAALDLQLKSQALDAILEQLKGVEEGAFAETGERAILTMQGKGDSLIVQYVDQNDRKTINCVETKTDTIGLCERWMSIRTAITSECDKFDNNCANLVSSIRNLQNTVMSCKVNDDFIEKQAIQWWDAHLLSLVLKNGGCYDNEFFRAYFLPVLQRALGEIQEHIDITSFEATEVAAA